MREQKPPFSSKKSEAPRRRAPAGDNPRWIALQVLCQVLDEGAFASLALDSAVSRAHMGSLDRRLCASLVYRTLENLYRLDFALGLYLKEPEKLPTQCRHNLRMAACQILLMDRIPPSAAVNEAVQLTRRCGQDALAGTVNAVLRRLAENRDQIPWPKAQEGAQALSVLYTVPEWLAQQLLADYGPIEAEAICAFRTERHAMTLRPTFGREAEFPSLSGLSTGSKSLSLSKCSFIH